MLLDVRLQRTPLHAFDLQFAAGMAAHAAAVRTQYQTQRNLQPMKVVLTGPPCSGKTALAQHLAACYTLPLLALADLCAVAPTLAPPLSAADAAAVAAAQAPGSTTSLPPALLARLCRAAMSTVRVRNRGYVLDGCVATLREARETFTDAREWSEEELAERAELATIAAEADAEAASANAGAKGAKGGAAKKAGKDAKPTSARAESAIDDVPEPRAVLHDMMPNMLVRSLHALCLHPQLV